MSQLVSIIIPCYNAAPWIAATIESALAQTWPEIEIIVVDDGSTDQSREVIKRYAGPKVRTIFQKNSGAAAARNAGLKPAQGDFIQFIDADDLISPGKISAQIRLLTGHAPAIATCAWGRFTDRPENAQFADSAVFRDFNAVEFLVLAGDTGAMMHPAAWLVPRPLADRAGPWDESLNLNDDGEYFCRVMLAAGEIAFCRDDSARSYYRSSLRGSLSQQRTERARRSQFRSVELISDHLLAVENSAQTRRAIANSFQRFIHDFYPFPPDLMEAAGKKIAALGGSTLGAPPMGGKTATLARMIGWRAVWKLKHRFGR